MRSPFIISFAALVLASVCFAQQQPTEVVDEKAPVARKDAAKVPEIPDLPSGLLEVVAKQFGKNCGVVMSHNAIVKSYIHQDDLGPWSPAMMGDVDGDGVEDLVVVAHCKDPVGNQAQFDYKVVDPMNSYFGFGDPKVTSEFNAKDPINNMSLLVIHGAGKEGWRAEHPKAKFILINLPFESASLSGATLHKKPVAAIRVDESDGVASLVYFDGKKWKYLPGAASGS